MTRQDTRQTVPTPSRAPRAVHLAAVALTLALATIGAGCKSKNHAAYFGWGGYVDTDLPMRDFFHGNHTVAARFMLQYPKGPAAPILASSGSAMDPMPAFIVGLGDYATMGTAEKLMLQADNQRVYYTLGGQITREEWHHIAVTREGCLLRLWFNGMPLAPDGGGDGIELSCDDLLEFQLSSDVVMQLNDSISAESAGGAGADPVDPDAVDEGITSTDTVESPDAIDGSGGGLEVRPDMLRLGRGRDGLLFDFGQAPYEPQHWGFIDDVAVFTRVLSPAEIANLASARRLEGNESSLLAGWTFDSRTPDGKALPDKLDRGYLFLSRVPGLVPAGRTQVTNVRDNALDVASLPLPFHQTQHTLPFPAGTIWQVTQEYAHSLSHFGSFAFCYDFARWDTTDSFGQIVSASADGQLTIYNPGTPECDNASFRAQLANDEQMSYLHQMYGFNPGNFQQGDNFSVLGKYKNSSCTECAPACAHLHFATYKSSIDHPAPTGVNLVPIAFSNYYTADPDDLDSEGNPKWTFVARGVPRQGDLLMRPEEMELKSSSIKEGFRFSSSLGTEAKAALETVVNVGTELGEGSGRASAPSRATAIAKVDMATDARGNETVAIGDLSIALDAVNAKIDLATENCLLPAVSLRAKLMGLRIVAEEPLRATVQRDGLFDMPAARLVLEGDIMVDAGKFGAIDAEFRVPLEAQVVGHVEGREEDTRLSLGLSATSIVSLAREDLGCGVDSATMAITLELDGIELDRKSREGTEPVDDSVDPDDPRGSFPHLYEGR